ncbi:hypothetical protein [Croceicoccus sp. BE223]|uniref:hypothetical protein n=1 Tax=Croceicoccus sp. BE223 TaxID=2817716 RepID=UPI00285988D6|nr:hypothetical protein [Croceicoccus sp. BE223]MDR7101468.1 hypothetical protein [Croceicoccus sp. BE223]
MIDPVTIAAGLTDAQAAALRHAMPCEFAGTYVGNCGVLIMGELDSIGLFREPPADGGGTWGIVARLNERGLAVRDAVLVSRPGLP